MGQHSNLVAKHPENVNAVRHGIYSSRVLAARAREVATGLMALPHVRPSMHSLQMRSDRSWRAWKRLIGISISTVRSAGAVCAGGCAERSGVRSW
jgi:hypothetical protein